MRCETVISLTACPAGHHLPIPISQHTHPPSSPSPRSNGSRSEKPSLCVLPWRKSSHPSTSRGLFPKGLSPPLPQLRKKQEPRKLLAGPTGVSPLWRKPLAEKRVLTIPAAGLILAGPFPPSTYHPHTLRAVMLMANELSPRKDLHPWGHLRHFFKGFPA